MPRPYDECKLLRYMRNIRFPCFGTTYIRLRLDNHLLSLYNTPDTRDRHQSGTKFMAQPLNFQQVILKLHQFWADQGCVIWEPYNLQVGAGTHNPATTLRVLGPEPWRVAYVEPSIRPDDGRYGENPNRM